MFLILDFWLIRILFFFGYRDWFRKGKNYLNKIQKFFVRIIVERFILFIYFVKLLEYEVELLRIIFLLYGESLRKKQSKGKRVGDINREEEYWSIVFSWVWFIIGFLLLASKYVFFLFKISLDKDIDCLFVRFRVYVIIIIYRNFCK